jgi:hypothetical protein
MVALRGDYGARRLPAHGESIGPNASVAGAGSDLRPWLAGEAGRRGRDRDLNGRILLFALYTFRVVCLPFFRCRNRESERRSIARSS